MCVHVFLFLSLKINIPEHSFLPFSIPPPCSAGGNRSQNQVGCLGSPLQTRPEAHAAALLGKGRWFQSGAASCRAWQFLKGAGPEAKALVEHQDLLVFAQFSLQEESAAFLFCFDRCVWAWLFHVWHPFHRTSSLMLFKKACPFQWMSLSKGG